LFIWFEIEYIKSSIGPNSSQKAQYGNIYHYYMVALPASVTKQANMKVDSQEPSYMRFINSLGHIFQGQASCPNINISI
jgi:hypothetical protein